jgi:PIN domain nuclease of toxin-antitoxin system
MRAAGIRWLPIEKEHCLRLTSLPFHHNDPFDRILIAQAQQEGMTFLSRDANLAGYGIPVVW